MNDRGTEPKHLTVRTGASIVINKKNLDGDLFRVVKVVNNKFYDDETTDGDISLIKVFVKKKCIFAWSDLSPIP